MMSPALVVVIQRLPHLSVRTRLTPAPYTGAPMFELEAVLSVPRATQLSQLRQKLGVAFDEINMDWDLQTA